MTIRMRITWIGHEARWAEKYDPKDYPKFDDTNAGHAFTLISWNSRSPLSAIATES